jgi:hypothetical protein
MIQTRSARAAPPPTKTYTLVYRGPLLITIVPDGADVKAAVAAEEKRLGQSLAGYQTKSSLALVDTIPTGATVFWQGHGMGWIRDETGRAWRYAVIPSAKP